MESNIPTLEMRKAISQKPYGPIDTPSRRGSYYEVNSSMISYLNYEINRKDSSAYDNVSENKSEVPIELSFCSHGFTIMERSPEQEPNVNLAFTSTSNFIFGMFMLFLMVVPCSIIGPLTISLPAKDAYVQTAWRNQGCAVAAIPAFLLLCLIKPESINFKRDFSSQMLVKNFISSFFLFAWNTGLILGVSLTVTSHADIMYSSSGVYILMITLLTCKPVHILELLGYGLYAIGVYFMFTDPLATKTGMDGQSYLGDLYAFLGAGFCAGFSYLNHNNDREIHPMVILTQCFVFSSIQQMLFFPFMTSSDNFWSFDPVDGAFGWLADWNAFFLVGIINAPITGILGNLGFYSSYYYFPMQIVAGAMLVEPFVAQVVGISLGQDEAPGIKTWTGLMVITAGFLIAGLGANFKTMNREKSCDYNETDDGLDYVQMN